MRFKSVLLVGALLVAGCGGNAAPPDPAPSLPPLPQPLARVSIPPPSDPARPEQTLQAPVNAFTAAWQEAMGAGLKFDARVGVAGLAEGDVASSFCADKILRFDITAEAVTYCRAARQGPDPAPYVGFVLVPYNLFMSALGTADATQRVQATGMVMARAYARHVLTEMGVRRLAEQAITDHMWARIDCVAGMTLRAFVPPMSSEQWGQAVAFARDFPVTGLSAPNEPDLAVGFGSGTMGTCLA